MLLLSLKNACQRLFVELDDSGDVQKLFCELQKKLPKALLLNEANHEKFKLTQRLSSNLSWYASLNNKAFGNIFCNPQKSFHTSPESFNSNNKGYQPFFKLNNSIY